MAPRDRQILKIDAGGTVPQPSTQDEEDFGFFQPVRNWAQSQYGLPGLIGDYTSGMNRIAGSVGGGVSDFLSGAAPASPVPQPGLTTAQKLAQQAQFQNRGRQDQNTVYDNRAAMTAAAMGGGGGGGSRGPNYAPYREALIGQADALNARIQAMYNQLAEQAGANVERISGIYGGAGEGIGNVYDSATGNVAQAFGSAQQQAADQLARLGIEAAAPAVINPMALSQAQAVSGLEQGRASGQAAAERYGATAGGFGSQMAQVAQQQGTEMNAAILAALQQRLNDSILMEEQGRMAGGGGGGASSGLTPYQEAQLIAGAEGRGIEAAQWEYEQGRRQSMDAANLALQIAQAENIPYTEALAQATGILSGQAPAAPTQSGNWFTNLFS
jgi:hypothetical protein